ncbi:unnamed protein product [Tilletia laevis]|uniref:Uncharacterized protein n=1 Tax=Tilletia caries TaxID=13290 RepID=A0A177VDR8_9BASI|nr:hypothetical protein CF336_g7594 [Tilletia laevis]KAE8247164.1 hypothetical protein A4X03_0g7123 [Tilletia caries]CAD6986282.1 unnamed protein product [Tilletia controversa]KAE8186578.1 hypothetical protein CF335_g7404 [Tilletia laevis]CAD6906518.1 unnamed protein product [Tilletia laevis]
MSSTSTASKGVDGTVQPPPAGVQASLAGQVQESLQWLYAFTMTRLVEDQIELMRKRLLNLPRFCALPATGYEPDQIKFAVEPNPNLRTAAAAGLFTPLLENWGLGMSIARVAQCFDVEGILWRDDVVQILQSLASPDPSLQAQHHELDLGSVRTRILSNLRALEQSIRKATRIHPREIAIDAKPEDDPRCNLLLPFTFPVTPSGSAGCKAAPSPSASSPSDPYPRPYYEHSPLSIVQRWDEVFNRVIELKTHGSLSDDPGWDSIPFASKKSQKSGRDKWDKKLRISIETCEENFGDLEKQLLRSDIGGPTAKMLSLIDSNALLQIFIKLIPTMSPPQAASSADTTSKQVKESSLPPSFSLCTIFSTYIHQGPSGYREAPRALFSQLYGPPIDFLPFLDSTRTPALDKTFDGLEGVIFPTQREERISVEKRNALARAAQSARDLARAHVGLPALGLIVRNEIMRSVRESANAAFLAASSSASTTGANAHPRLEHALQSWKVLSSELKRQAEADRLSAIVRAQANEDCRSKEDGDRSLEEGWARAVSNALDISTCDHWAPSSKGGEVAGTSGQAKAAASSSSMSPPILEKEAGLIGGVLVDPGLDLNVAAALLKLERGGEEVVRAATTALGLLAAQQPPAEGTAASVADDIPLPLIDESTGPAEVLDAAAFWLGGGCRSVIPMEKYDPGYYGAGYAFGSSRITQDIRFAERRERRLARRLAKEQGVKGRVDDNLEEEDGDDEEDSADEDEGERKDRNAAPLWHEDEDDEPAAGTWTVRSNLGETETQARERVRLQRLAIREARGEIRSRLIDLLGTQLGSTAGSAADVVTPGLPKSLLAPGRTRSREAWEELKWKALVRRGKGLMGVLQARVRGDNSAEEADEDGGEESVQDGQERAMESAGEESEEQGGQGDQQEQRSGSTATSIAGASSSTTVEELGKLARKDFEAALALDPASAKVPRSEMEVLEGMLAGMRVGDGETAAN